MAENKWVTGAIMGYSHNPYKWSYNPIYKSWRPTLKVQKDFTSTNWMVKRYVDAVNGPKKKYN